MNRETRVIDKKKKNFQKQMIPFQKKTRIVLRKIINKNKLENTHKQNKNLISICIYHAGHLASLLPEGVIRLIWMSKFYYVCTQLKKKNCEDEK